MYHQERGARGTLDSRRMSESDDEALLSTRLEGRGAERAVGATMTAQTLSGEAMWLPHITIDGADVDRRAAPRGDAEFEIVATLGEGGMGRVHLARQRSMDREVAVKTLKQGAPEHVARALLREARMTGMLEHPGVIPVHALGIDDARAPLLVMKRVDGVDLATHIAKDAPLYESHPRLVFYVETLVQVCRTLEFAHSRRVIHRDVKPENIMVGSFGEVYLLDWGIAITKNEPVGGTMVGTPITMAPEMARCASVDERTDVYLVGATLHMALTGKPLHAGSTVEAVTRAALASEPYDYPSALPEELVRLCHRATSRSPDDRPRDAAAMREALSAYLQHRSARALAESALARVAELEAMVASGTIDLARAHRLVAEGRFALEEALRQDPEGGAARAGLRRVLVAAAEVELAHDRLEAAKAILAEIAPPDAALAERCAARAAALAKRETERRRLVELGAAADPTADAQTRTRPTIFFTFAVSGAGAFAVSLGPTVTSGRALFAAVFVLGLFLTIVAIARRKVWNNGFNRRLVGLIALAMTAILVNRLGAFVWGQPVEETLARDLLLAAVAVLSAAITLLPTFALAAGWLVMGYVGIGLFPAHVNLLFNGAMFLNLATGTMVLRRAGRTRA